MPIDNDYWSEPAGSAGSEQPLEGAPVKPQPESAVGDTARRAPGQAPRQTGTPPFQGQGAKAYQGQGIPPFQAQASAGQAYVNPAPQVIAYAPVAPARKSHGWIVAIVVVVCLFAFTAFCVKACTDSVGTLSNLSGTSGASLDSLDEDAIAIIDLAGTIQYDGTACSPEGFKELLDEASDNKHVKAIVLRVNSGGGTATAGEEMAEYLKQFDKPVVVSSASINASAAYEISAQADYIYVAKSTEIGSIGTAMQVTDLSGLLGMLGVNMDVIASSESKDSSYGFRPLTEEERAYYQRMVNQINDMFIENVSEGRGMTLEEVRALANGLAFTGVDAVENGLADAIGTREDAVEKAAELAGIQDYTTCDLYLSSYDLEALYDLFGEDRSSAEDIRDILQHKTRSVQIN